MKLNLERASLEFGVNRRTLARRLEAAGLPVAKGTSYTIRQVFNVLAGRDENVLAEIDKARLANLQADAEIKLAELATINRESIPATQVLELWSATVIALKQAVWNFDAPEDVRRKWLSELRDLKVEDYFSTAKGAEGADD
ncbi:MAG: hypothetical protein EBT61_07715 [Verrucomicrobia bacterium]|nr:hypothetical protein [Verrucomicrobiota bacterium]